MAFTFYAARNEFAASTGDNVNNGNGTSTFDYPPTSTFDLVVTSHADDDDARLFSLGDTYSISFKGHGGTSIENATVIRSDPLSGNEGAIVFEGLNPQGDLVQVVWSPNFDLEGWYYDNFDAGASPGFYTTDQDAATYKFACFAEGTLIDTEAGPRAVERLCPGDMLVTRDNGLQPALWIARSVVPGLGRGAPVTIEPGVLGAEAPVRVSPQHRLLVSDPRCEPLFGVNELMIAATHLVDGVGIRRQNAGMTTYYHILLERHEILRSHGLYSESLLLGDDMSGVMGPEARADFADVFGGPFPEQRCYKPARNILKRFEAPLLRPLLGLEPKDVSVKPPSFFFAG